MHVLAASKILGLVSLLVLVVGLAFLALRWPQGRHATFSQHAAAQKKTIIYYIVLFIIALPLLLIFFVTWFVPTFHLSVWFLVFAIASELLQHIVTFIPEIGGWKTRWHRLLTGCSAALLVPMLLILLASSHITKGSKVVVACGLACMIFVILYGTIFAPNRPNRNQLFLQIGYYGAFFAAIMTVTYSR